MSNPILQLVPHAPDKTAMLEVLEDLRRKVEAGEIIAFVTVGLQPDDETLGWSGSIGGVTRLRVMGAIASLQHSYHDGALG